MLVSSQIEKNQKFLYNRWSNSKGNKSSVQLEGEIII